MTTIALLAASVPVAAAERLLPSDVAEIMLWDRARTGDRVALKQYLERYPHGYWSDGAQKLSSETTPIPPSAVQGAPLPEPSRAVLTAPSPAAQAGRYVPEPPRPAASARPSRDLYVPEPPLPAASRLPSDAGAGGAAPYRAQARPPQGGGSGSTMPPYAPVPDVEAAPLPEGDPVTLYDRAFGLLRRGDWVGAERAFGEFVQRWPRDELAPNARYWLAETLFVRGEDARAARAFAEVYERTPQAPRAPDALYKEGVARERAGDHYGACTSWTRLKRSYPADAWRYEVDARC